MGAQKIIDTISSSIGAHRIDSNVKEIPKNPFDFIWDSESLLKKLPLPTRPPASSTTMMTSRNNNNSVVVIDEPSSATFAANSGVAAHSQELVNANTVSATTLETSIANTTVNDGMAGVSSGGSRRHKSPSSNKKSSKKSKGGKSSQKSNKVPREDLDKVFLVDEFNKQQTRVSTGNLSPAESSGSGGDKIIVDCKITTKLE